MRKMIVLLLLCALLSGCSPYSTDISDLDCNQKISFLVNKDDSNGRSGDYLRTVDFSGDTVTDTRLKGVNYGCLISGPASQDYRVSFYSGEGDMNRLYKVDADGSLSDGLFYISDYEERDPVDKFSFITYNEYERYGWLEGELRTWQDYSAEVLAYDHDGRAAAVVSRDTGKKTVDYTYKDENGKKVTVERDMLGYTLGIEDAQGNFIPVLDYGEDTSIHEITHAGWIDGENLLLVGVDARQKHIFYRTNIHSGQAEAVRNAKDRPVQAYSGAASDNSYISVSPDGRFAAYRPVSGLILVTDLRTGSHCCVYNHAFSAKTDGADISYADIQFWH